MNLIEVWTNETEWMNAVLIGFALGHSRSPAFKRLFTSCHVSPRGTSFTCCLSHSCLLTSAFFSFHFIYIRSTKSEADWPPQGMNKSWWNPVRMQWAAVRRMYCMSVNGMQVTERAPAAWNAVIEATGNNEWMDWPWIELMQWRGK